MLKLFKSNFKLKRVLYFLKLQWIGSSHWWIQQHVVSETVAIGCSKQKPIVGRKADAMLAAYYGAIAALKLIEPYRKV